MNRNANELLNQLAAPFAADAVRWKPQSVSGNRALAVAYVDARTIMNRLDDVIGPANWQDDYQFLEDGSALCRLKIRLGDEWIQKVDVGGESEQSDQGDRRKAAVSDGLKGAAVKFGVGRYLYELPSQWVDFDPAKKKFVKTPTLPAWALPRVPATVTEEQARQLQRFLQENRRVDAVKFLAHFGAGRLTQLPAGRFADALAALASPPRELLKPAA